MRGVYAVPPPLTSPHKGEGDAVITVVTNVPAARPGAAAKSPSPLWGGVRGGGSLA